MIDPAKTLWSILLFGPSELGVHRCACPRCLVCDGLCLGPFDNPERGLGALGDVADLDVIELGCGAYISAWLARLGARPVGVDLTPAQLDTARRCQERFGLSFPLIEANAEGVPRWLPSIWPSASTGRAYGATHNAGYRRRLGFSGPAFTHMR
jgi:hypothetical protein